MAHTTRTRVSMRSTEAEFRPKAKFGATHPARFPLIEMLECRPRPKGNAPMRRREFIALLGGTAATWPLAVRAQQSERIRRIGVLMNRPADDVVGAAMVSTFKQSLQHDGATVTISAWMFAGVQMTQNLSGGMRWN